MKRGMSLGLVMAVSWVGAPHVATADPPALTVAPVTSPATTAGSAAPATNPIAPSATVVPAPPTAPTTPAAPAGQTPQVAAPDPASSLDISEKERQYFRFGYSLSHSAFAYAELAKRTTPISHLKSKSLQIHQLAALAPLARKKREQVALELQTTLETMRQLQAPAAAIALIEKQRNQYSKSSVLVGDAKQLGAYDAAAGQTMGALDEFETTSGIPENPALRNWMTSPTVAASARVWYAEGLIAGLAEIAAQQEMPELLPPLADISTDLRGLRDWLATRLPEQPSPSLDQLRTNLDGFLNRTGRNHPTKRPITLAELTLLGNVSKQLAVEILGADVLAPQIANPGSIAAIPATIPAPTTPETAQPAINGAAANPVPAIPPATQKTAATPEP